MNSFSSEDIKGLLNQSLASPVVFLETASLDADNKESLLFENFYKIITFNYGDNLDLFFKKAETYLNQGYWLCGYFSYEFGYFLEPALDELRAKTKAPLAWLGVCKKPRVISHKKKYKDLLRKLEKEDFTYKIKNIKPNINRKEYSDRIKKIKIYLEEGLTYQVNYTFKLKFDFFGKALGLYLDLRESQPTGYSAFVNTGKRQILSLSPELFFRKTENKITTRPMKGTVKRGLTLEEDAWAKQFMQTNEKNQAENLMIVDLLRNDLGRISENVKVLKLFDIEEYRTLHQMTSTITAELKEKLKLKDMFSALFPCGSVTGAPKIKTMKIIKDLESESRDVYTGSIGYISPDKKAVFNVAIRTVVLEENKGELGIGGGIVYDSQVKSEYDEAILKANFFTKLNSKLALIETILYSKSTGYKYLSLHLKRLKDSCKYFSIDLNAEKLLTAFKQINIPPMKEDFIIRVLVNKDGKFNIEKKVLTKQPLIVKVKLSSKKINPDNPMLYHKTNQRELYDKERQKAIKEGFYEVLFFNTRDEVTEGSITNIFIQKNKKLYTPPLKCGLLPGVLRQHLLNQGKAREKVICLEDVLGADKVYVGNSVRGLIQVET